MNHSNYDADKKNNYEHLEMFFSTVWSNPESKWQLDSYSWEAKQVCSIHIQ